MTGFFTRLPAFTLWRLTQVDPIINGIPEKPQTNVDIVAKSGQSIGGGQVCTVLGSAVGNAGGSPMTGNMGSINTKGCGSKPEPQGRVGLNTLGGNVLVNFIPKLGEMEKRLEFTKKFPPQLNRIISEESEANKLWFEQEKVLGEKPHEFEEQQVSEVWVKQQADKAAAENERKPKPIIKSLVEDYPRYTHVALLGVKHCRTKGQRRIPRHPTSPRQRADYMRPFQLQKRNAEPPKKQFYRVPLKQKLAPLSPIVEAPIELRRPHVGGFNENYKQRVNLRPTVPGQRGRFPVLPPEPDCRRP